MRNGNIKLAELRAFDAEAYCQRYPDIAQAITTGELRSAWTHYDQHGRREGRALCAFDEEFYLRSYPGVAAEVTQGLAETPLQHYILYGRARGFVPNLKAVRPANAALPVSQYGGLWIDDGDALDRIKGRFETGQITRPQADLLEFFVVNGYVILPSAIEAPMIEGALADFDKAFRGGYEQLKFEAPMVSRETMSWRPEMMAVAAKALDIHHFSGAIRRLMFAPAITEFLALIFDNKMLASQSLGFLRGSAQESHQDSAYVTYTLPLKFAASWIALEDVSIGAGELFYYPGSHRLPDFRYSGRYKSLSEAERMGGDQNEMHAQGRQHVNGLDELAKQFGLAKQVFPAKRGDVLIWHSDLIHGGHPVSEKITRKSIVTHYCPKHVAPLFSETHRLTFHEHDGHLHTSSHYSGVVPLD
jgi:phytanoyl-CoA hydroxylase